MISFRLSKRSTITPAKRPKIVNGRNCASASTPTATGEWVSVMISQPLAMFCIHEPVTETIWPPKKRR